MNRFFPTLATAIASISLATFCAAQSEVVGWGASKFDTTYHHDAFVQVAAAHANTLALAADGTIATWGKNNWGMLNVPAPPQGLSYVQIAGALGGWCAAAILSDGTAVVWGDNSAGQANVPPLPPGTSYLHIGAGSGHVVALRSDGAIVAWGDNSYGQCNVPILPQGVTYVQAEALAGSTLGRRSDGAILVWGYNADGQCNVPALPAGLTYVDAAVGYFHILATRSDRAVVTWGYNINGQCNVPPLPTGLSWVKFCGGTEHSLGLRSDGSIVAWGSNVSGQCNVPPLPPGLTYLPQMAAGGWGMIWGQFVGHSVAIRSDGSVVSWGQNDYFECNAPPIPSGREVVEVSSGGKRYSLPYAMGEAHALARLDDGSVLAWGRVVEGQCNVPALPAGLTYVEVDAGTAYYSLARRSDGSLVAFGNNSAGQCNVPALPVGLHYVEASAGERHALARRSDGSAVAWGSNGYGQCNVPPLPAGLAYVEVAAGWRHSLARRNDGSVVAFGSNAAGQCNVPALPSGLVYVELGVGYESSFARRSDGAIVAWGDNSLGQCDVPTLPPGMTYVDLAVGADYLSASGGPRSNTLALRSDGRIVVWGDTSSGQASPPPVPAGLVITGLSAGAVVTTMSFGTGAPCPPPTTYCIGAINSTGKGASIGWQGSTSLGANDFVLEAIGCPPTKPGLFFFGKYQHQIPFGEGYLCITGFMQRLLPAVVTSPAGAASYQLDFTNPASAASLIEPGSEWNFQLWYRDPQTVGHGFNLTDALNAVFCE